MFSKTNASSLIILILAFLVTFLGIKIISWSYEKTAGNGFIEQQITETIEKGSAELTMNEFMTARMNGNEDLVLSYLTEAAVDQYRENEFILTGDLISFKALSTEKISEEEYRFLIETQAENSRDGLIESITIIKILEKYYIDSIAIAG